MRHGFGKMFIDFSKYVIIYETGKVFIDFNKYSTIFERV